MGDDKELRLSFFRRIFSGLSFGYICLARLDRRSGKFSQVFIRSDSLCDVDEQVEAWLDAPGAEIYFCPHLLSKADRKKENAMLGHTLWADLDPCHPNVLGRYGEGRPNIIVNTSPGHWQAYWIFEVVLPPSEYEDLNHRVALAYKDEGCDQSGWDLTQLLRVPLTYNNKREPFRITYTLQQLVGIARMNLLPELSAYLRDGGAPEPGDMTFLRTLGSLTLVEAKLWNQEPIEGERSELVFKLVHLLKVNLGWGDGLILETLQTHPVLFNKWVDPADRRKDIQRCLMKMVTRS